MASVHWGQPVTKNAGTKTSTPVLVRLHKSWLTWFLGGGILLALLELNGHYPWWQLGFPGFAAVFLAGGICGMIVRSMFKATNTK